MAPNVRPYLYYDTVLSICSTCYQKVEGKILFQDQKVFMLRRCPRHGSEKILLADDIAYYRQAREVYLKPPEQPCHYNTPIQYGCPYDCGLCPDHEQHSCLSVLELTDHCNLSCPICYASSGPHRPGYRSLEQLTFMLDAIVRNEGEPDVVQLSGGEPTLHPEFFAVLEAAKARPIRHLMINTNGIRLANDEAFAERLASYRPGLEVYLQFDALERDALMRLRGADLRDVRARALQRCDALGLGVTLVVTVMRGVNDHILGDIVEHALSHPSVRGVTFQPVQDAGRTQGFDPAHDRLTLTEVRRKLLEQSSRFGEEDVVPVPCHPDAIAMAYALRLGDAFVPFTRMFPSDLLTREGRATIAFERDPELRERFFALFATNHSFETQATTLRSLLCCLPELSVPVDWTADKLFRVIILQFMDAHSFDVRSVKKSCVHIVHPDGRLIPFDTYNLFYRDELEQTRLAPLRAGLSPQPRITAG